MTKQTDKNPLIRPGIHSGLFDRVAAILDEARGNVVRAVNSSMVAAYWLIGREITRELQGGDERAEYGKQMIETLSSRLTDRFGRGFSAASLWGFRRFYQVYADRGQILYEPRTESTGERSHKPLSAKLDGGAIVSPSGRELALAFSPQLSWTHYRALARVQDNATRDFYEQEAIECGWSTTQLERQIHTAYYQRILAHQGKAGLGNPKRDRLPGQATPADEMLKSPYVLEFLNLPDAAVFHENNLEQAIIDNLQTFLLELGKGFSFVARQKHIRFDDNDFYIDLVFYNYLIKCFLLIDLKIGKLTHADVGQMDGYVRLFEGQHKVPGDNPTIGLILCSDKGKAVAKYSILNESRRIFASEYLQFLPTEEELRREIEKERRMIEAALSENKGNGRV